jgi:hypothetical protein
VPQPCRSPAHRFALVSELVEDATAWAEEEAELPSPSPSPFLSPSSLRPLAEAQAQIPQPQSSWASCLSRAASGSLEEA